MYENIKLIITILFIIVAGCAIISGIIKMKKNKDKDEVK